MIPGPTNTLCQDSDKDSLFGWQHFNGAEYEPEFDQVRLTGQIERVYKLMRDGQWRTLAEIEEVTGDPQASISGQLRNFRKARFGGHEVNKRPRDDRATGLWEYQLCVKSGVTEGHSS